MLNLYKPGGGRRKREGDLYVICYIYIYISHNKLEVDILLKKEKT